MVPTVASNPMTRITLSFMLSLLSDNNFQGPDAPVNSKYHWSYKGPEGPDFWHINYKYCAGERQSPINIITSTCVHDPTLEPIVLGNFDAASGATGPCILNVTNNGHAASIRVTSEDMWVQGGGLGQKYKTAEFHLHWGSTDDVGSEHSINGRKYPLEMHVVNFAEKYGTVKQAMTQPDGLAVLGVFFELSDRENPHFAPLDDALRHVHKAGEHTTVNQLILRSLLPEDLSKFWRYNGSLTTPFCFESVAWTVFAEPVKVSKLQLETLRSLLHEDDHDIKERGEHGSRSPSRLVDNWRPLQALNGRVVKRSFADRGGGSNLNTIMLDAKMTHFEMSPPAMSNFDDASAIIVGGANINADSLVPSVFPTYAVKPEAATEQKGAGHSQTGGQIEKKQAQIEPQNKPVGQQNVANEPVTVKDFISNSGSGISMGNSTDLASSPESLDRRSNTETSPADNSMASPFGQMRQSNLAPTSSVVVEPNKNVQTLHFGHTTSNLAAGSDVPQSTNRADTQGKLLTSTARELQTAERSQQGISVEKSVAVSSVNLQTSSTSHNTEPHRHVGSNIQPSTQISSSPQPQTERGLPEVRRTHQQTNRGLPVVIQTPPQTERGLPEVRQTHPQTERGLPEVRQTPPQTERGLPVVRQSPPHTDRGLPEVRQTPHQTDPGLPEVKQTPPQTDPGLPEVKQTPPQITQHKPSQQPQIIPQNMNLNSRVGPMDSRIAELANQIRLHRQHGHAQHNQQNRSQPIGNTDTRRLSMPPVIRHNQRGQPPTHTNQNGFYEQSRQHSALQHQRQQILQMTKPPTPQQLRAILEKLAATNRINAARPALITSGAAEISQGRSTKSDNSGNGHNTNNLHQPSSFFAAKSTETPPIFSPIHALPPASSSSRSSWINPSRNSGFSNQNVPGTLIPQPYWPQHLQHQQMMQNEAYQQEMQRPHQQQFLHNDWASHSPPLPRTGYPESFLETGPGVLGMNILPGPHLPPPDNSKPHVYLNSIQHPVRIRRPVFEQLTNWHQRQYQIPHIPYFV